MATETRREPAVDRRPEAGAGRSGLGGRAWVWLLTGPLGRVAAFLADAAVLWWRWMWRRRTAPGGQR